MRFPNKRHIGSIRRYESWHDCRSSFSEIERRLQSVHSERGSLTAGSQSKTRIVFLRIQSLFNIPHVVSAFCEFKFSKLNHQKNCTIRFKLKNKLKEIFFIGSPRSVSFKEFPDFTSICESIKSGRLVDKISADEPTEPN